MHDNQAEAGRLVDMDRHIQQTNDRLQCIKQHLQNPQSFQNAARELLEWCSDTRAFQLQFEDGLMGCLTVISKTSSQPGYDLELGYRLLAICASHKDMFTPKSAGLLSTWCEELGRSLLLRHQKTRPGPELSKSPPGNMHPQMQKPMAPVHPGGDGGWGGPNPGQPGQQQLSVVTTIWGVTPATQSGPYPSQYPSSMTGAGNNHMGGPQAAGYHVGPMPKGGAGGTFNPAGLTYRRDSQNRYGGADGSAQGMMTPATGLNPHLPMGVMSSGVPTHMAGVRQVTAHTQVHAHPPVPGPNPLVGGGGGGGGSGGGVGMSGGAVRMPLPPHHPMRSSSRGPPDSSPLNHLIQAQSPHNPAMQGQSSGNSVMPAQSPHNAGMQSQSPLNPGMQAQSPLNAAMQGGQVQGVVKPSMHPSPLHGDPGSSGYPPTPNTPGSNQACSTVADFHPPSGALNAAAIAAATATATATAVVLEQQHQSMQHINQMPQYPNTPMQMGPGQQTYGGPHGPPQFPPGMGPMATRHMNMTGPIMGKGGGMSMVHRRPAPYPQNHPGMVKRQYIPNGPSMDFVSGPGQMGYPNQYPVKQFPPAQQPLPSSPTGYMPAQNMRPMGPAHFPSGYGPMPGQYPPARPPPNQPPFPQYPNQVSINQQNSFQHSPLPGNPTPPITPQAGGGYPPDMKPFQQDIKPRIKRDDGELRLTFPVRDGVVLNPFRLEHNLAVSNHEFHLRDSVYQTLVWRSDLELQLKCFHHEDRQMNTNWPASVTVSVNATPLNIERGENKSSHKPLYLKDVCTGGRNTIQITVTACCCSHLFVLQLVHRPSIRSVLQGLLRKRLLPAEHCITKIKRNFSNVTTSSTLNGEDGVEQTAIKVSLKCPITCRRISLPARGHDCKHIQCFDLESYLKLNCERGTWRCPVCNKTALLEGLEIDQYIWAILTNLQNSAFEEVDIDPAASWKPVPIKTIKEEENDSCSHYNKPTSPSSTQLPTVNSWNMNMGGQIASPFPHMQPQSHGGPGDPMPGLQHADPNQPSVTGVAGRPPSLPGPLTPSTQPGGPATPQQQNGSHPLSHPPPASSSGPSMPGTGSSGLMSGTDCGNLADINFDPSLVNGDNAASGLDLLPDILSDQELSMYLGSEDNAGSTNGPSDDILSLFDQAE